MCAILVAFGHAVEGQLMRHRESILEKQYLQARLADAATELYMMSAVIARLDAELQSPERGESSRGGATEAHSALRTPHSALGVGRYYCHLAARRIRACLKELSDNLDAETTAVADALLA